MSDRTSTTVREPSRSAQTESWSFRGMWSDYWRVVVIGFLAMLVAYLGSFALAPTYSSTARVLLRANTTTSLNSTGGDLSGQSGLVNSQLATALADTQAALVSNRHVAEVVVDKLKLDEPKAEKNGPIAKLKRGIASVYKHARGYLTAGFYKNPSKHEVAVETVAKGLTAKQVHDGFALDVTGSWTEAKSAADIANTAADALVQESNARFRTESATFRDYLKGQVAKALTAEQAARSALARYKTANNIVSSPEADLQVSTESADALRSQVRAAQAELDADRAQVSALDAQLANTPTNADTTQQIQTGRSSTKITQTDSNPVYTALLTQRQQAAATVAAVSARLGALQGALASSTGSTGTVSEQQAQVDKYQLDLTIASDTRQKLAQQLESATVNAQSPQVELTRVASAGTPTYPIAPKRYLFLIVGLFLGALVGFVWSFFRVQKRQPVYTPSDGNGAAKHEIGELSDIDLSSTEQIETVGASSGERADVDRL
jgi:uncharacterized protein involved in exopolysaccharide biosynthesis